jgi:hypothetical protein
MREEILHNSVSVNRIKKVCQISGYRSGKSETRSSETFACYVRRAHLSVRNNSKPREGIVITSVVGEISFYSICKFWLE